MSDKKKKTDRRTLYTCKVIKESFLDLLSTKEYIDITVSDICRKAEINRGTFYLHYDNVRSVLNELCDDALDNLNSVLVQVGCVPPEGDGCSYPLCRFIRDNKQYQSLFFSDSLRSFLIDRIAIRSWSFYSQRLRCLHDLGDDVFKSLLYFQLNGCIAVCKQNIGISDKKWNDIQCNIDRFLMNGFKNL